MQQRKAVADANEDGHSLNHPAIISLLSVCPTPKRTGWIAEQTV